MVPQARLRKWYAEEDNLYVALPYGPPTTGQYFGPPVSGGPPGTGGAGGKGFHARKQKNTNVTQTGSVDSDREVTRDVTTPRDVTCVVVTSPYIKRDVTSREKNVRNALNNAQRASNTIENETSTKKSNIRSQLNSVKKKGGMYPGPQQNTYPGGPPGGQPNMYHGGPGGPPGGQPNMYPGGPGGPPGGQPNMYPGGPGGPPGGQPNMYPGGPGAPPGVQMNMHPGGPVVHYQAGPGAPPQGPPMGGPYPGPGAPQANMQQWQPGQGGPHQWDNLPSKPLDDNPNAEPPPYVPPSMDGFQRYQGYEGCGGFGQAAMLPPPPPPPPPSGEPPPVEFDSVAMLSEDECRQAMLEFVGKHCCYGKGAAEDMKVDEISPSTAMHYILETFCETRSTGYEQEPYRGGMVDGPQNGMPPGPWDIPCQPDSQFSDHNKLIEVPHTSSVVPCNYCHARGFTRCHRCHGLGWNRCMTCHGDGRVTRTNAEGHPEVHSCSMCGGDGRRRCHSCGGDGRVTCRQCKGFRQMRCFIRLTVSYKDNKSEYVLEKTDMPDELVKNVQGTTIFEQTMLQVWPIVAYKVQEVNDNSVKLVEQHRQSFLDSRKLNQRHQLRAVPVTEVQYSWKDTKTRFWVYGREREVHAPDYPQQCCWGCNIL